jgi:glycosyltransferase involved in cell wall biosynthesis
VAPATENICDVVADRRNGILFRAGDARHLADCLAMLAAAPSLRAELGAAARASVETERSWTRVAENLLARL